ncbi:hypothetical protein [Streptomyces sp. NPDC002884]|uniref:hypothetical protein n=1 Tax=Streptomyces sp. NPDC002884 TaxID=3154544 RepID=UPI00331DA9AB
MSRHLRRTAAAVDWASGHDPDGSVAARVWADGTWSSHRYGSTSASCTPPPISWPPVPAGDSWPFGASPDLLECALFTTTWQASG